MNNPDKSGSESDVSSESSWTVLDELPPTDSNCRLQAEPKQNEEKTVKKCEFFLSTPELFPHIDDEDVSDTCQIFKAKPVDDPSFDDSDEERLSVHSLSTSSSSSLKDILGQNSSTTLKTKRGCAETPENIETQGSSESDLELSKFEPFEDFLQVKTKRNKRKSRKCKAEAWGTLSIVGTVLALTGACFLCLLTPSNVTVASEEIQYVKKHFDDPSALNRAYSNSTACPVVLDNEGKIQVSDKSGLINQSFRKNASSPTEAYKFASRKLKNLPNIEIKHTDVVKAPTTVSESAPAVQGKPENVTVRDGPITYAEFLKMNRRALKTLECKKHYVDDIIKSAPERTKAYLDKRAPLTIHTEAKDTNQLVVVEEQFPSTRSLQPSKDSNKPWKELLQNAQPSQFSATPAFKEMDSSSNKTTATKANLGNNITSKQNTSKINSLSESVKEEKKNDNNIETTNCFKHVNESVELNSNSTIINQDISKNMTDSGHVDALIKLFEDNTENSAKPEEEQDAINLNANETTIDAFPTTGKNYISEFQPTDDMSPVLFSDLDLDLDYSDDKDATEPDKELDDEYTLFTPQHQTIVCHIMNDIMLLNLSTKLLRKLHAKEKKIKKQKTSRKTLRLNKMNRSATDMTHGIVEKQQSQPIPSTTTIKISFNGKKERGSTLTLFRELPYAIEQDCGKPIKISLDGGTKIKITDLAVVPKNKKNAQVKASKNIVPSETKIQTKKLLKVPSEHKKHRGTITAAKPAKSVKKPSETSAKIREENIRINDYKKDIQNLRKKQDEYFEKLTKQHKERMEYLQSMRQKQHETILSLIRQRELKTQLRKDVACGKYQVPVPSNDDVLAKLKKLREKTSSSPSFTGSNVLNESQVFCPKYLQDDCHVRSEMSLQKNNASIKPTEFRSSSSRLKRKYHDTFNEELDTDSQINIKKHNETASKYRLCTTSAQPQEYFNNKVSLIYDKVDKYLYMRQKYLEKRIKVLNTSLTALHGIMSKTPEKDSKKRESFKAMVNKVITIMKNENNLNKERKTSSVEDKKSFPNLLKELITIEHQKHAASLPINNVQVLGSTKSHAVLPKPSTSSSRKLALYNSLFGKKGQEIFKRDKDFWYFERHSIRNYLRNVCKNDPRCNTYGRIVKKYQ